MSATDKMNTSSIPRRRCRICDYICDHASNLTAAHVPKPGDYDVCLNCGALSIFTEGGNVRPPTAEEREGLPADGIKAIVFIKQRGRFFEAQ